MFLSARPYYDRRLGDTGFRWTEEVALRGKGCVCLRWGQGLRVVFSADGPEQVTKHWPTCTHIFTFHREEYFKEIPGKDKPARFWRGRFQLVKRIRSFSLRISKGLLPKKRDYCSSFCDLAETPAQGLAAGRLWDYVALGGQAGCGHGLSSGGKIEKYISCCFAWPLPAWMTSDLRPPGEPSQTLS